RDIGPFPDGFFAAGNIAAVTSGASQSINASGGLAGGQIGYLFQSGRAILGVEAAFDWTNFRGSLTTGPTLYPAPPRSAFTWTLRGSTDFLATFTGRLGLDMGSWYPYLTGGGAYSRLKYSANFVDTFYPTNNTFSFGNDAWGWVLGAGAEWRFADHWML